jgi:hypothetical protein
MTENMEAKCEWVATFLRDSKNAVNGGNKQKCEMDDDDETPHTTV